MYYFLLAPVLSYNWLLIVAAVVPAVFLMVKVHQSDRLEKEPIAVLLRMAVAGVLSALAAMVIERIAVFLLDLFVSEYSPAYDVILYFIIVAFAEEGAKYALLKNRSWYLPDFNCQYDAIVYAVFVSLGFALWENVSYVLHYGFSAAIVRAITAIPGHACFGVFMGVFYGMAMRSACVGQEGESKLYRVLAVLVPALIHGAYDYIATVPSAGGTWFFILFIVALFAASFMLVNRMSKNDRYFQNRG